MLVSLGGDIAVAGPAPDRRLAGAGRRRPRAPRSTSPARRSRSRAAASPPRARPSAAGAPAASSCTTSSTRAPAARPRRPGGRSPSPLAPAWTRTSRAPPRSSSARRRSAWLAARGCRGAARRRRRARSCSTGALAGGRCMIAAPASGPSAYWYLTRGTGVVALLLLTAGVAARRPHARPAGAAPRWPRFVVSGLHRNVTLLALVLRRRARLDDGPRRLHAHRAPRRRRPVRLALPPGLARARRRRVRPAARTDRDQPPARAARPARVEARPLARLRVVAGRARARVRHGSDAKAGWFDLLATRFGRGRRASRALACRRGARGPCGGPPRRRCSPRSSLPAAIAVWATGGPLASGWARRAGTPARLLAAPASTPATVAVASARAALAAGYAVPGAATRAPFSTSAPASDGLVTVGHATHAAAGRLEGPAPRGPARRPARGRRRADDREQRDLRPASGARAPTPAQIVVARGPAPRRLGSGRREATPST